MATSASDLTLPEPPGLLVPKIAALPPSKTALKGNYCTLTPLTLDHVPALYQSLGSIQDAELWAYIASGPFPDEKSFRQHMEFLLQDHPFYAFAILPANTSDTDTPTKPIGLICFLNIVPSNRSIEIGHVVYSKSLQRTTAATEAVYLMMKHCFEDLHYLRVEWKANDLNAPSKRAAERLGFVFEGVFRKHQVVKGRRRDTAWFSVCDDEWVGRSERVGDVKMALEAWLEGANFDAEGRQKRKLEEFRMGSK